MNEILTLTNHDASLLALFMVLGVVGTLATMSLVLEKFTELVYSVVKSLATKTRSYGMHGVSRLITCILCMFAISAFMYKGINFENEMLQLSYIGSLKLGLVFTLVSLFTMWLIKPTFLGDNRVVIENKEDKHNIEVAKNKLEEQPK